MYYINEVNAYWISCLLVQYILLHRCFIPQLALWYIFKCKFPSTQGQRVALPRCCCRVLRRVMLPNITGFLSCRTRVLRRDKERFTKSLAYNAGNHFSYLSLCPAYLALKKLCFLGRVLLEHHITATCQTWMGRELTDLSTWSSCTL